MTQGPEAPTTSVKAVEEYLPPSPMKDKVRDLLLHEVLCAYYGLQHNLYTNTTRITDRDMVRGAQDTVWEGKMVFLPEDKQSMLQTQLVAHPNADAALIREHGCELTRIRTTPTKFCVVDHDELPGFIQALHECIDALMHAITEAGEKTVYTLPRVSVTETTDPSVGGLTVYGWLGIMTP